jgi:hypothetical protein
MDATLPTSTSPQIAATAPDRDCPKCGRRMQVLSVSPITYSYVCYAHTLQNTDTNEPYYLNVYHKFLDEKGMIKIADPRPKR